MALVSALIPTYNRAEFVTGAVETVLNQTYDDVEAVVVDDGSTDGTRDALARYADDDRVRVHSNDENRGIAYSFNRAADLADGEFYCILGDDDRWHPEKVERQVERMRERSDEYGVVYTAGIITADGRVARRYTPTRRGDIYPDILAGFDLHPHSGHMLRREAFEAVDGFDTDFPRGVDWEMCVRLAREYAFDYVDEPLVERTRHGDNVSAEPEQVTVNRLMWEKHGDEIRAHPAVEREFRGNWARNRAFVALDRGAWREAVRAGSEALRRHPTPQNALTFGLAVGGPVAFTAAAHTRRLVADVRSRLDTSDERHIAGGELDG
ncbi:glycosyltransferase family 2 protein [Halospeciosus flavus]|uniref:Glycosyltransferase family 2 protein n=2 Tax=Halospeciosus flavus TaxID=3032283 RepID=A0ABD5YYH3_9EURY